MPVAALTDRTAYPGYDLENLVFDLDDPEFEDIGAKVMTRSSSICSLSIRQSKSDSILQAYEHFYSQHQHQQQCSFETIPSLQQQPHHHSVTFFCGGDCDSQGSVDSTMLTIEELRSYNKSCATCGVSWYDEHVSLDCSECGGYAMERPCPLCDGQCHNVWRRDLDGSHNTHKAKWEGVCLMRKEGQLQPSRQQSENDVLVKALDQLTTPL